MTETPQVPDTSGTPQPPLAEENVFTEQVGLAEGGEKGEGVPINTLLSLARRIEADRYSATRATRDLARKEGLRFAPSDQDLLSDEACLMEVVQVLQANQSDAEDTVRTTYHLTQETIRAICNAYGIQLAEKIDPPDQSPATSEQQSSEIPKKRKKGRQSGKSSRILKDSKETELTSLRQRRADIEQELSKTLVDSYKTDTSSLPLGMRKVRLFALAGQGSDDPETMMRLGVRRLDEMVDAVHSLRDLMGSDEKDSNGLARLVAVRQSLLSSNPKTDIKPSAHLVEGLQRLARILGIGEIPVTSVDGIVQSLATEGSQTTRLASLAEYVGNERRAWEQPELLQRLSSSVTRARALAKESDECLQQILQIDPNAKDVPLNIPVAKSEDLIGIFRESEEKFSTVLTKLRESFNPSISGVIEESTEDVISKAVTNREAGLAALKKDRSVDQQTHIFTTKSPSNLTPSPPEPEVTAPAPLPAQPPESARVEAELAAAGVEQSPTLELGSISEDLQKIAEMNGGQVIGPVDHNQKAVVNIDRITLTDGSDRSVVYSFWFKSLEFAQIGLNCRKEGLPQIDNTIEVDLREEKPKEVRIAVEEDLVVYAKVQRVVKDGQSSFYMVGAYCTPRSADAEPAEPEPAPPSAPPTELPTASEAPGSEPTPGAETKASAQTPAVEYEIDRGQRPEGLESFDPPLVFENRRGFGQNSEQNNKANSYNFSDIATIYVRKGTGINEDTVCVDVLAKNTDQDLLARQLVQWTDNDGDHNILIQDDNSPLVVWGKVRLIQSDDGPKIVYSLELCTKKEVTEHSQEGPTPVPASAATPRKEEAAATKPFERDESPTPPELGDMPDDLEALEPPRQLPEGVRVRGYRDNQAWDEDIRDGEKNIKWTITGNNAVMLKVDNLWNTYNPVYQYDDENDGEPHEYTLRGNGFAVRMRYLWHGQVGDDDSRDNVRLLISAELCKVKEQDETAEAAAAANAQTDPKLKEASATSKEKSNPLTAEISTDFPPDGLVSRSIPEFIRGRSENSGLSLLVNFDAYKYRVYYQPNLGTLGLLKENDNGNGYTEIQSVHPSPQTSDQYTNVEGSIELPGDGGIRFRIQYVPDPPVQVSSDYWYAYVFERCDKPSDEEEASTEASAKQTKLAQLIQSISSSWQTLTRASELRATNLKEWAQRVLSRERGSGVTQEMIESAIDLIIGEELDEVNPSLLFQDKRDGLISSSDPHDTCNFDAVLPRNGGEYTRTLNFSNGQRVKVILGKDKWPEFEYYRAATGLTSQRLSIMTHPGSQGLIYGSGQIAEGIGIRYQATPKGRDGEYMIDIILCEAKGVRELECDKSVKDALTRSKVDLSGVARLDYLYFINLLARNNISPQSWPAQKFCALRNHACALLGMPSIQVNVDGTKINSQWMNIVSSEIEADNYQLVKDMAAMVEDPEDTRKVLQMLVNRGLYLFVADVLLYPDIPKAQVAVDVLIDEQSIYLVGFVTNNRNNPAYRPVCQYAEKILKKRGITV